MIWVERGVGAGIIFAMLLGLHHIAFAFYF